MARSCSRNASAIPARRDSACALSAHSGSPDALPLVATSAKPSSCSSSTCSGVLGSMAPRRGLSGARSAASAPGRASSSTMGAAGDCSSACSAAPARQAARTAARSGNITASGLCGRCLRARRRATAAGSRASVSSWNPPRPFSATMPPSRSTAAAAASAVPPCARAVPAASQNVSRGPQAGQALAWCWKRRLPGSAYSAAQAAHGVNAAMAVRSRSYGMPATML